MEITAKQKIAHAAFALFLEKGYHNTTIREIAQVCGFSHVNVLRHYNSKGELAIHMIEAYVNTLIFEVKKQATSIGLEPSSAYSDLYWLTHYSFLERNTGFARLYHNIYEAMRDDFHILLTNLSNRGHVTAEDLMGVPMVLNDYEADLYSKLISDADLHMVHMLIEGKIDPVWAVQGMTKLIQLLLLRRTEDQIVDTAKDSRQALQQEITEGVCAIEQAFLHKN